MRADGSERSLRLRRSRSRIPRSNLPLYGAILAITALFSYFALRHVQYAVAWRGLRNSDFLWLVPALAAFALAMIARAFRWRSLFAPDRRPPLGAVSNAMMLGYLYNTILPARSGEVARVMVLSRRSRAEPVEIAGTAVLERLYDVVAILAIFFVAEPWLPSVSWLAPAAVAAGVLAAVIAASALAMAFCGDAPVRLLLRPLRRLVRISDERYERTVSELSYGLSGLRDPRVACEGFLWTILAWMMTAVLAYLVSLAFRLHLPFACGVLVTAAVGLAMILPSPPAALGVFEGAALVALRVYGLSHSAALPYALVLHLVTVLPFIVIGVGLLHYNSRHVPAQTATGGIPGAAVARTGALP